MRFKILLLLIVFMVSSFSVFSQEQKPVDPIDWKELIPFLVDISGWEAKDEAEGKSLNIGGYKISQAERNYVSGNKELRIQVVDGSYLPMIYASIKMAMEFEMDTGEEYQKKITVKVYSGVEQYHREDKEAAVIILIADRFLLRLEGRSIEDPAELRAIAETLDLDGIAGLAN